MSPQDETRVREIVSDMIAARMPACRDPNALSEREVVVLRMLAEGQPNKSIARDLGLTESTIKVHVKAVLRKMGVANRTQAAIRYVTQGGVA